MKEAPVNSRNSPGEQSTCCFDFVGRLALCFCESADEIGAAHNTDNPAIAEYRHALYAVGGEQPCNFGDLGLLAGRDHRRRHDVAGSPLWRTHGCEEICVERLAFREHGQPPVATSLAIRPVATDQVALADHADRCPGIVDHGHCTHPVLAEDLGDIADRRVGTDRDHRRSHYVACFHPSLLAGCCCEPFAYEHDRRVVRVRGDPKAELTAHLQHRLVLAQDLAGDFTYSAPLRDGEKAGHQSEAHTATVPIAANSN